MNELQSDTIPRINQRLYKLLKALKNKEIEFVGHESSYLQSLQSIGKNLMINNIDLKKLEDTGRSLSDLGKFIAYNYSLEEKGSELKSKQIQSIMIIAKVMLQCYNSKRMLMEQDDEFMNSSNELYHNIVSFISINLNSRILN